MLKRMLLAACVSFAAALTVVASAPLHAQSQFGTRGEAGSRVATAPPSSTATSPATSTGQVEALDPVPSETMAPVPPEGKAPEASEAATPPSVENAAPARAQTVSPAPADPPAAQPPAVRAAEIDPVIVQVRQQLAASRLPDNTAAERAAVVAFYADRNAPLWVTADGFTGRGRHAMAEIARADDWGLSAKAFLLPAPASADNTPAALADAEIKITVAVLKYARYARGGRLDPSQVSRNFDQKLTLREPKVVLETVAGLETPGGYLRALHPRHPQFEMLRQALLKARSGTVDQPEVEAVAQLPEGPALKPGMRHPDVVLLRQRLKLAAPAGAEDVYDRQVQEAVADFQRKNGIKPDGSLGARTRTALNGGGDKPPPAYGSDEQRLIANMERWRWMPEDMGEFHVWDNIPEFQTRVVRKGQVVHQAKIIVGRVETQTTIFSANMRYVVFGPEWGVPDSIKVKELLPYLRTTSDGPGFFGFGGGGGVTDTRVLEKHNLRVSYNGQPVDPSQIDFRQVDIRKYNFIQPSGPSNALGAVKFRFPNKHDIYMHDTPQRELFEKTVRTFSHGCMRVQNPGRLAEVLLEEDKGWSSARVRELMERGGNNEVTLSKQIPVHITYFTTVASEDGQVRSFGDVYGHDKRVASALAGRPMPLEAPSTTAPEGFATKQETSKQEMSKQEIKEARRGRRYDQAQEDPLSALFGN